MKAKGKGYEARIDVLRENEMCIQQGLKATATRTVKVKYDSITREVHIDRVLPTILHLILRT